MSPSQHRKHRGYQSQKLVAQYLAKNGFPYAEPAGAGRPGTDVTGVVGFDIEVKARRGFPVAEAMRQMAQRYKQGDISIAILRMDGQGPATVDQWPAILTLGALVELLREAGYGDSR